MQHCLRIHLVHANDHCNSLKILKAALCCLSCWLAWPESQRAPWASGKCCSRKGRAQILTNSNPWGYSPQHCIIHHSRVFKDSQKQLFRTGKGKVWDIVHVWVEPHPRFIRHLHIHCSTTILKLKGNCMQRTHVKQPLPDWLDSAMSNNQWGSICPQWA